MQVCRQRKNLRITNAASTKNNPSNHRSPLLPSLSFIVRPEKQLRRGHRGVISSHRSPESDVSRRLPRFRYRGCFEAVNKFPHFGASGGSGRWDAPSNRTTVGASSHRGPSKPHATKRLPVLPGSIAWNSNARTSEPAGGIRN